MAEFRFLARHDQPYDAVGRAPAILLETDGVPDFGAYTVRADNQVGFPDLAALKSQKAFRVGTDRFGVDAHIDAHGSGAIDERIVQMSSGSSPATADP